MIKPKSILFSERAENDYNLILDYLFENWSKREVEKFEKAIKAAIKIISTHPLAFPASRKKTRRFVLDDHTVIHYRVKKNFIEVATLWPGKRNPKRLKL
ncbi:MAG: type II toxin-antitoxin system RelE/ParE family toxin [Bacteroidia bacterium]|nr:type II toxin-antitoxin system RelE/ParE family toxin [Bacteroidia bacterium]